MSETFNNKFIDSLELSDWEIETDTGWVDATHIHKTIEFQVYKITLDNGLILECADDHCLFTSDLEEVLAKDSLDKTLFTKYGESKVISVEKTAVYENMYDITVDSENHRYYTNNILSHNTTTLTISILHYILFNDDKEVALLGNKEKQAKGVLSRIKLAYELLPMWLKHGVTAWNKKSICLANDCLITASSTSSDSIRGDSISFLFIDECAFIDNWEEFYTSTYPVISSGKESRIVLVSTANGMNHFYKLYEDARKGDSSFAHFRVDWTDVPGRDEEWKEETISNTSEEAFMQEHENIFLGSSNTLISIKALHSLVYQEPIYDSLDGLVVFKKAVEGNTYVAVVDTSRGSKNDYSALSIIDVTQYPFEQVARYRNNSISYRIYPDVVYRLVKEYNDAWTVIENNDIGGHIVTQLNDSFDYEYLVNDSAKAYELGVRTTTKTKNIGCSNIKDLVERNQIIINDFETISEFSTFEEKGKSYEAVKGHNDDLAIGMVMFGWFTSTDLFEDISNKRIKRDVFKEDIKSIYEKLLPEPMIVTGLDDEDQTYTLEGGEVWEDDREGFL